MKRIAYLHTVCAMTLPILKSLSEICFEAAPSIEVSTAMRPSMIFSVDDVPLRKSWLERREREGEELRVENIERKLATRDSTLHILPTSDV